MGRALSINTGRCGNSSHVRYLVIDAGEERLELLLDVFDRLAGSTAFPDSRRASSDSLTIECSGHIFTQEMYDIFCKDEKVYIMHNYYPRTLGDISITDWFCLKDSLPSSASSTRHLDPDGTFQRHTERIYEDVLLSLRLLSAELTLGLLFIHSRGIVHLDIEPGNISVTPTGHVQICNFTGAVALPNLLPRQPDPDLSELGSVNGRSIAIMDSPADSDCEASLFGTITLDSKAIVTSKYAAPELLEPDDRGRVVFDSKADWWGLGSVLLELAYNTEDHNTTIDDGNFADFLHQTLSKDPQKRLAGSAAQSHEFFNFDADTWDEILDLHHAPCPGLPETSMFDLSCDQDISESTHGSLTDTGSLMQASQGHGLTLDIDISEENQGSDVQPFPSTASLHQQGVFKPDANEFKYGSGNLSLGDFGPALEDSVSSSVYDPEYDEDDSIIIIRAPCYDWNCSRISCVSCHGDWKEQMTNNGVALPQVGDGKILMLDERDDSRGHNRFNRKRLGLAIAKSSERVINRISKYIFKAFRC